MVEIRTFTGPEVGEHLSEVAALRIAVFRDYPYLYDGSAEYEQRYLATYARSARSLFVLVFDGNQVVGASTGVPLEDETENFQLPFRRRDIPVREVFYFGESVLLPRYRGQGIGHRFFDEREAYARRLGRFRWTAFCAVVRPDDHPLRPRIYRGNEALWTRRGYVRQPDMQALLAWKDRNQEQETEKPLAFWLRPLESETSR